MRKQFLQAVMLMLMTSAQMATAQTTPYQVQGGNKVDDATLAGWRAWRNAACERCHGPNQEGMVGPSLIVSLRTLGRDDFNLHPVEGFQSIVQRHDARSLVAVVVGDQNFHGLR